MSHSPLAKEIIKVGTFVDWSGQPVEIKKEDIAEYVNGANALIEAGHPVCAYPSHGSDDSMEILGKWRDFEVRGESAYAIFDPEPTLTPEQVNKVSRLNVSAVIWANYDNGQVSLNRAITRVDIVGAGAILGLAPFQAALSSQSKHSRGLASGPSLKLFEKTEKEKAMISDKIAEMKALMGFDGDDEAFVAEMKSQLASEYPDSEPEEPERSEMMDMEGKDEEEQDEEEKKSKASELSTPLSKRIRELERKDFDREIEARVSRLSGPIPQKTINRVKADYGKLYGKLGHDDAARMVLDGLDDVIAAEQKTFKLGAAIPQNRTRFTDPNKAATDAQVLRSAAAAKRIAAQN